MYKVSFNRKKVQGQNGGYNNNNQQRSNKPRFSHGGGGNNRPRKNYGAMREKYLAQARDALAAGDRVLAENYFQHADHCFRMLAEEQASRPQRFNNPQRGAQTTEQQVVEEAVIEDVADAEGEGDDTISTNVTSLPAFLTSNYEPPKKDGEPVIVPNWEEE